jgi:hypothetical protein
MSPKFLDQSPGRNWIVQIVLAFLAFHYKVFFIFIIKVKLDHITFFHKAQRVFSDKRRISRFASMQILRHFNRECNTLQLHRPTPLTLSEPISLSLCSLDPEIVPQFNSNLIGFRAVKLKNTFHLLHDSSIL